MGIVIKKELDPTFETVFLLFNSHIPDWKGELIQSLQTFGINGELFLQKHFGIVETYLKTFQKHKQSHPKESFFFENIQSEQTLLIIFLAAEHRTLLNHGEPMDLLKLRGFLASALLETFESLDVPDYTDMPQLPDEKSIIEFLKQLDIPNEEKWFILELLMQPDYWISQLLEIVTLNIPAYEKAVAAVKTPLKKLLSRFSPRENTVLLKLFFTAPHDTTIYPSLSAPLLEAGFYTRGYQGLLIEELTKQKGSSDVEKETLLRQLKSLSDKSKLDILCALKTSSKYNLELSEALNLSPSTMSHHMNVLLTCGLVTVEKMDGRVYYCLEKEAVSTLLSQLNSLLL
mgnify:CR=1 FL=1